MSDCKFQVGQTYKTRGGKDARVVAIVPDAGEYWRVSALYEGEILSYSVDGRHHGNGECEFDLMPNKRKVWAVFYGGGEAIHFDSEPSREDYSCIGMIGNRAYPVEIDE